MFYLWIWRSLSMVWWKTNWFSSTKLWNDERFGKLYKSINPWPTTHKAFKYVNKLVQTWIDMAGFIVVYFYRSETYMYFISLICKDLFEKKIKCETNK